MRQEEKCSDLTMLQDTVKDMYTDDELKCLWDIYLTYKQRGGRLHWTRFAMIPLTHKSGDIENETGMWTKYIREHLAEQGREMLNM